MNSAIVKNQQGFYQKVVEEISKNKAPSIMQSTSNDSPFGSTSPNYPSEFPNDSSAKKSSDVTVSGADKNVTHCKEDHSWILCLNTEYLNYKKCRCQGCLRQFITFPSEKQHVEKLISAWTSLRALIREVYLNPPTNAIKNNQNILNDRSWLKEALQWLCMTEPYQLLDKIQNEVVCIILESRCRFLDFINRHSVEGISGEAFVTGLIEEYVKLLSSAFYLRPVIDAMLSTQLIKFQLSWETLNKYMYFSLIYLHKDVRQMWPKGYHQLRKCETHGEFHHSLFEQLLTLDREMELVDSTWKVVEPVISEFRALKSRETVALKKLQAALKVRLSKKNHSAGNDVADDHTCSQDEDCSQLTTVPWPDFSRSHLFELHIDGPDAVLSGSSSASKGVSRSQSACSSSNSSLGVADVGDNCGQIEDGVEECDESVDACKCYACAAPPCPEPTISEDSNETRERNHGEGFLLYPHIYENSTSRSSSGRHAVFDQNHDNMMGWNGTNPDLTPYEDEMIGECTAKTYSSSCAVKCNGHGNGGHEQPGALSGNNPYLLSEYSHLYSVLSSDSAHEKPSLIMKALTGGKISLNQHTKNLMPSSAKAADKIATDPPKAVTSRTILKSNVADVPTERSSISPSDNKTVTNPNCTLDLSETEMKETSLTGTSNDHGTSANTSRLQVLPTHSTSAQKLCNGTPKPLNGSALKDADLVKKTVNQVIIKKKAGSVEVKTGSVMKDSCCSTVTTGSQTCGTAVCGKCCKPSKCSGATACVKNNESHHSAITRLALSKCNPRNSVRCSEHANVTGKCHSCPKSKNFEDESNRKLTNVDDDGCGDCDYSSEDDCCSERSNSTCTSHSTSAHKDPRHCDCCYCQVFGHAVQTVAPVSRNYQEMRERLRLRLNMKKKCKSTPPPTTSSSSHHNSPGPTPPTRVSAPSAPLPKISPLDSSVHNPHSIANQSHSSREDLDSLLQFIEGNLKDECVDEKRIAKRARQKQKKIEEREEKERLEREAELQRLEELKLLAKKNKKAAKKERQREAAAAAKTKTAAKSEGGMKIKLGAIGSNTISKDTMPNSSSQPKMVTIRRVMEPFGSEPTVTITIKDTNPDKDGLIYSKEELNNVPAKKKKKSKKGIEMDISDVPPIHKKRVMEIISKSNEAQKKMISKKNEASIKVNSIKAKLSPAPKPERRTQVSIENGVNGQPHITISTFTKDGEKVEREGKLKQCKGRPMPINVTQAEEAAAADQAFVASRRFSEAIRTSVSSAASAVNQEIKLENLRLPPGITITKIDAPKPKLIVASDNPGHVTKATPIAPPLLLSHGSAPRLAKPDEFKQPNLKSEPNVIVVDTGRLEQVIKENGILISESGSGKKKNKNKKKKKDVGAEEIGQAAQAEAQLSQQATIIKTSQNMVTIRSPQLQRAIDLHAVAMNGLSERLQRADLDCSSNGNDGDNTVAERELAQQMTRLTLADARAAISAQQEAKKRRRRRGRGGGGGSGPEEDVERPENVFKPKDIDLESGDMDDDERELEAFKRFCQQSVPAARKDKVKVNLNIKDIVLKKKSSPVGCS